MNNIKINLTYDRFYWQEYYVSAIIKKCIKKTLSSEGVSVPCEINVLVTDDSGIRQINKVSRSIDKATDVLSFPMFSFTPGELPEDWSGYIDPETDMCPLGDMAISLERAIEQATEFDHTLRREVGYLTIHSMLHLLGYDHLDEGPKKIQMRQREEAIASGIWGMKRTGGLL